jgi:S1-C subfamily serine protease
MRRESSEQRRGSATVTIRRFANLAQMVALAVGSAAPCTIRGGSLVPLLASTAACSTTWTGSVGAVLGKDNANGRLFVRDAPAGMGAARAGLQVGDEVVAIDGRPVATMTPAEVHEALSGKVGTTVRITVIREGVKAERVVERGPLAGT